MKFNINSERNLSMLMDFYELTMSNGYFENGLKDKVVYFDLFYRRNPDGAGFSIAAGLEQLVEFVSGLHFDEKDIEYLRSKKMFSEDFLSYLRDFRFSGDIYAVPEGTPMFPNEALVTVRAKVIEAQLLETMLLVTINHQSLIATKANRIARASQGRTLMEFGARRSHSYDSAIYGARAAYIGGASSTSNTIADELFGVPASGTMAHSWVQLFEDEYEAFKTYAQTYPDTSTLLVDTYEVLSSGVPNAIRVAKEVLEPAGHRLKAIRIDSGDLAYFSKESRKMLDEAGLTDCRIVASSSLDEYIITDIISQGARIDIFGVGERLITSKTDPVFGGVYKLVAVEEDGEIIPRIKISENPEKITNPGYKMPWRLYSRKTGRALADIIAMADEEIDDSKPYAIFDPVYTWKKKEIEDFCARKLQVPVFLGGECVYELPALSEIREYCRQQMDTIWDETKRFVNPQKYYVDLSEKLWKAKNGLIEKHRSKEPSQGQS
jgi:nicotinate phosphoribosyltransferase